MKVWKLCLFFFLRLSSTLGEDTDIGEHQLERLAEMLTSQECRDLQAALSPNEQILFKHLERLLPQNNLLTARRRAKRVASPAEGSEAWCRMGLSRMMMERLGKRDFSDRLARALQHIGRTDIAMELEKNVNQEQTLNLKRFVDDYHKYVNSLNTPSEQPDKPEGQKARKRRVRDLTWRDLDLIVERSPVALYHKGPMDVALPLFYGFLLGFGGTLLTGVAILLVIIHVSSGNQQSRHTRSNLRVGHVVLEDAASGIIG